MNAVPATVVPVPLSLSNRFLLFLSGRVDALQAKFPPNRLAVIFGPFLAIAAGAVNAWAVQHFPGLPHFTNGQVAAAFGIAFLATAAKLYKFIDGCQKDEQNRIFSIDAAAHRDHEIALAEVNNASKERIEGVVG